ncbi:MAG: hypothetical protein LUG83_00180 [Lachnospiraceae bacterium]|nr:hypothetical protein [Lachnospiraceae bacterium]
MLEKIRSCCNKTNLFLALIFFVGIATTIPYGAFLDQSTEQNILYSNIKEYLMHFPSGSFANILQSLTDSGVEEISVNIDRYNGMAVYYPAFPVWYLNKISPYLGNIYWHVCIFGMVFVGIVSLYKLIYLMFGDEHTAAFTTMLFFLTPRMFAECHYNNKDMVVLSLTFVLMYKGMKLLKAQSVRNVCAFAVAGAFLSNMKVIGIWIFGVLGCYILAYFILTKRLDRRLLIKAVFCAALYGAVYMIITPACWGDIKGFFEFVISCAMDFRWNDYVLFNGEMYNKETTGIPASYLPVMIVITVPLGTLLLGLLGIISDIIDSIREKRKCLETAGYVSACAAACFVPLIYAIIAETPVYNGWRHFYFVYAAVIIFVGYGIQTLIRLFRNKRLLKLSGAAYLIFLAVGIAFNYPQNYSYYNMLAGSNVSERFELDYWDLSTKQAYEIILKDTDDELITVGAFNNPTLWGLEENMQAIRGTKRMRLQIADDWHEADYVIVNTTYAYMYSQEEAELVRSTYELLSSIISYGNTVCEIYKK